MSEHAPQHEKHEEFTATPEAEETVHHKASPEHQPRHEKLAPVPELAQKAKEEAVAGKELPTHEKANKQPSDQYVSKELKQQSWNRVIKHVQKQLSGPQRAFSKTIHQPVVDAVSRVGGNTVARPSGVLMGGICAFAGSTFFLYMAKHYGFTYNYLLFLLFFVGGFAVGLVLEMIMFVFRRNKA